MNEPDDSDRARSIRMHGERFASLPFLAKLFGASPAHRRDGHDEPDTHDATAELVEVPRRFQRITGLVFDMGDVLFDATAWRRQLLKILRQMGLQASYRSLFKLWDADYLDAVHRGERDYAEAFTTFLQQAGLSRAQVDEVVAASHRIKRTIESEARLFPGVRETLERLAASGLRLAVLSDSESSGAAISTRLATLGVGRQFSVVVSSVDLGRTKPDPLGYRTTLDRMGLRPDQAAFVGHDADELHGARRCGLLTIAFNYDRDAQADWRIQHFNELCAVGERGLRDEELRRRAA